MKKLLLSALIIASSFCKGYSQLTISLSKTNNRCYGTYAGSITANPTGGTTPYTYLWSNGYTVNKITSLPAGTYTVTVTDANSSTATKSTNITQGPIMNLFTIPYTNSAEAIVNGGVPPYTYIWNTSPNQTTSIATGLSNGIYKVKVTDTRGCTLLNQVEIQ